MMPVRLTIPEPCHENWDAMTPTATGRHCAACQKTVVDFTLKTDAEILAHLAQAAGSTCGRVWADQLARPLAPAKAPVAASRWRTWLAAAATVWALRETTGGPAVAQAAAVPHAHHPRKKAPRRVPMTFVPALHVRGVVLDVQSQEPLPGVAVFLKGRNLMTTTDSAGRFSLRLAAGRRSPGRQALVLHRFDYQSQTVFVPASGKAGALAIGLRPNGAAAGAEVVGYAVTCQRQMVSGGISAISVMEVKVPSAPPGRLRRFYNWLTRPFRSTKALDS